MTLDEAQQRWQDRTRDEQAIVDMLDKYTLNGAANILSRIARGTAINLKADGAAPELIRLWERAARALDKAQRMEFDGSASQPSYVFRNPIVPSQHNSALGAFAKEGPKEGDTATGPNGIPIVFSNGHWRWRAGGAII